MKFTLALSALVLSFSALAETATYNVSGMHCGGCAKMIEDGVCKKMEGVKTCKGEVIDADKKIGKVTIETNDGVKIDQGKVSELLAKAGEGYTIMPDAPATAKTPATKKAKK
jgi:copper chaperone CopZ